jgi:hypothetical protein
MPVNLYLLYNDIFLKNLSVIGICFTTPLLVPDDWANHLLFQAKEYLLLHFLFFNVRDNLQYTFLMELDF